MELKVIERSKTLLKLEVKGEDHTLLNSIRKELWNDKDLNLAGYHLEHPLVSSPVLIIETKGKDAKKVLTNAIDRLKEKNEEAAKQFKALAKNL